MHIRTTLYSSYYNYIYSSDIPKSVIKNLDRTSKEEQSDINFKVK